MVAQPAGYPRLYRSASHVWASVTAPPAVVVLVVDDDVEDGSGAVVSVSSPQAARRTANDSRTTANRPDERRQTGPEERTVDAYPNGPDCLGAHPNVARLLHAPTSRRSEWVYLSAVYAIVLLLLVAILSLLITRFATVALTVTGMTRESARFQARSALTGAGFTTQESEAVVSHPGRWRSAPVTGWPAGHSAS